jgi:cytochrome c peroxidase
MNMSIARGQRLSFLITALAVAATGSLHAGRALANEANGVQVFPDPTGAIETLNVNGPANINGAFFQSLGSNGRSCSTCHIASQSMSMTPPQIRERFVQTRGADPLFAAVDGANCANARPGDAAARSLLLQHGLIRIPLTLPAGAQFTVTVVHDPYGCALTIDALTGQPTVSEYRRPLPTTNLRFLSTMMFDGRESPASSPLNNSLTFAANLQADLTHQAMDAIMIHAQAATPPTAAQLNDIVGFEMGLSTAQRYDRSAGPLQIAGALGGARNLVSEGYYPGINDVLGADPKGIAFDETSMTLFAAWENGGVGDEYPGRELWERRAARRDIAAGEVLFNTAPLTISAVRGLNDNVALGNPISFKGTCTSCHDAPNVGDHSLPLPLDIGVGHTPRPGFESDPNIEKGLAQLDAPDLPIFLISGCPSPFSAGQPVSFYTTDLGKGLVTGLCSDLNRVKGPILRGLAARAPYFHNCSAATLMQAVNFYNQRFSMNLSDEQKRQLVAFLNSL